MTTALARHGAQPLGVQEWQLLREQAAILLKSGFLPQAIKTPEAVEQLSGVIDEVEEAAWSRLARGARRHRRKREFALVDLDGHIKPLYGDAAGGCGTRTGERASATRCGAWLGSTGVSRGHAPGARGRNGAAARSEGPARSPGRRLSAPRRTSTCTSSAGS